jgi:prevent-host-death family protein
LSKILTEDIMAHFSKEGGEKGEKITSADGEVVVAKFESRSNAAEKGSQDDKIGFPDLNADVLISEYNARTSKDARDNLGDVLNEARYLKQRTIITQHGKISGVLVPFEDLVTLHRMEKRPKNTKQRQYEERVTGPISKLRSTLEKGRQETKDGQPRIPRAMAPRRGDPSPKG